MPPKLGQIVETILSTSSVPKLAGWYSSVMAIKPFISARNFAAFSLPDNSILLLFDRSTTPQSTYPAGQSLRTELRTPKVSTLPLLVMERKVWQNGKNI
jgi:hypothetical protein